MSHDFEKEIENVLGESIEIPESIVRKKEFAFEEIRKNKTSNRKSLNKKRIAAAAIGLSVMGIAVFGNNAIASFKSTLFGDSGVQKAVNSGYIQNINESTIMKDNGVEIQAKDVAYDKNKIMLSLNIKFDDKKLLEYFYYMKIDFDIYNENGEDISKMGGREWSISEDKDTGEIIWNGILSSNGAFEDLDSINLKINEITLLASIDKDIPEEVFKEAESKLDNDTLKQINEAGVRLYKEIEGTWESNIKLDEKFKEGKEVKYNAVEDNENVSMLFVSMYPTGTKVSFIIDKTEYKSVDKISLVDDKGNSFKLSDRRSQEYVEGDDSKVKVTLDFDATTFDIINNLKLIFKDIHGKDFDINLIKE